MRRLILLRHAKSDRSPGVADLDRPLNPRGKRAAPRMGAYLAAEGLNPDAIAISPSLRTRQTWEAVQPALKGPEAEIVASIYEAPETALLAVVRSTPDAARSLLMIGHNPGLQELALRLAGSGDKAGRKRLTAEFPTAAIVVIDFEGEAWSTLASASGRLDRFVAPKDLDIED
ncbi:SixA phosphatase family protein [Methylobacterium sp. J-068]|uniref:SixA phosphatase family protein n=1 Tax=Methylobacterium sp. J-068 TaxID=2836649 RepID=UPI001FBA3306|nr:histidine phosphatase family protein [Methylobacterium sp. J-068]MCJ2033736.1 histidine phosphatase family protein [Methylobacterium sp. J-068]